MSSKVHFIPAWLAANLVASKASDPFDYEQKFPEDEWYKEVGPLARV